MRTDAPLNFRYQDILTSIVRAYIDTGEPVGSRTISKRRHNTLSPASIRNVMADLADEGYLSQPHTSAGRVPTEKAFRFFVSSLTASRVASGESDRMTNEFRALDTVGERVERSSLHPDGTDAQRRHRRRHPGTGPGTGPDRAGAAGRPPRADDSGDTRPHGAQPGGHAGRADLSGGVDFDSQLRQPQLQRLAAGRGAARAGAAHRRRARPVRRGDAQAAGAYRRRGCWMWTRRRKSTWKAPPTCWGWTCT